MKTMKKGDEIRRVNEEKVKEFLSTGWEFCAKKLWKEKNGSKKSNKSNKSKKADEPKTIETAEKPEKVNKYKTNKFKK